MITLVFKFNFSWNIFDIFPFLTIFINICYFWKQFLFNLFLHTYLLLPWVCLSFFKMLHASHFTGKTSFQQTSCFKWIPFHYSFWHDKFIVENVFKNFPHYILLIGSLQLFYFLQVFQIYCRISWFYLKLRLCFIFNYFDRF